MSFFKFSLNFFYSVLQHYFICLVQLRPTTKIEHIEHQEEGDQNNHQVEGEMTPPTQLSGNQIRCPATDDYTLRINQWNVSSIKKNTISTAKKGSPHIICFQETRGRIVENSPSYSFFYNNSRSNHSGGLAIAIHKSLQARNVTDKLGLPNMNEYEVLALQVVNQNWDIILLNFYFHKKQDFKRNQKRLNEWQSKVLNNLKKGQRLVVTGDFNIGQQPFNCLKSILGEEEHTFMRKRNLEGILGRSYLVSDVNESEYIKEFNQLSDHALICAKLIFKGCKVQKNRELFNKERARQLCFSVASSHGDFTSFYHSYRKKLRSHNVITKSRIRLALKSQDQEGAFDEQIKALVDDLQRNRVKEVFQRIKRLTVLNPNKKDGGIFTSFIDDDQNVCVGADVERNCLQVLAQISRREEFCPKQLPSLPSLTEKQVNSIQEMMSKGKAIYWDGISDYFIKETKNWRLLNDLWNNSTLETNRQLARARLVPLNKVYPAIPTGKQFRPITVLSPLFKFMELRFLWKLQDYLNQHVMKEQNGFIQGSSTQVNISVLLQKIISIKSEDDKACVFIDFSNAYNTIDRQRLYKFLRLRKVLDTEEVDFIEALHSNIYYQDSQFKNQKYFYANGVPQGSPISPQLFNIYLDEFLREFSEECPVSYEKLAFADDLVFITKSSNVSLLLKYLEVLSVKWELMINKAKSGVMPLHKRKITSTQLRGIPIQMEYRYLGITINNVGSIDPHIRNMEGISKMLASKIRWLVQGSDYTKVVQMWSLIVKPHFLYLACALNIQKFKKYYSQVETLYKYTFKKALGISKGVSDDILKDLMPEFEEVVVERSRKVIKQVHDRGLKLEKDSFKHMEASGPQKTRIKLKFRNIPKNIHFILNKQRNICEQHKKHMTPDHILKEHLGMDAKEVINEFKEKKNLKQVKVIEKKISEFQNELMINHYCVQLSPQQGKQINKQINLDFSQINLVDDTNFSCLFFVTKHITLIVFNLKTFIAIQNALLYTGLRVLYYLCTYVAPQLFKVYEIQKDFNNHLL
ncbi:hypothetical protein pb186bvf_019827 [Paramecium bursaria]